MLWFMCCIPVFTIGAATTALYYTVNKSIKNDRGYASSEFFSAFKSNFKQSTVIWLIFLAIYALLGFDYYVMKSYADAGVEIGAAEAPAVVGGDGLISGDRPKHYAAVIFAFGVYLGI